ncbi:MAG: M60 family metallopeptidase [Niabella sp.]
MALLFLLITIVSCAKKNFDVDTAPEDSGYPADSAKTLIDTTVLLDASKYLEASIFPGLVCDAEERIASVTISMDLNYKSVGTNLRIAAPPEPLFSTGYYAAPGELITIDVPEGQYQLSVQIGGWTDDLSSEENPSRDPVIYLKSQLAPGRNYLRNLYGGTVYINSAVSQTSPVSLTLGNVVKSPDFILGESANAEWYTRVSNSCVPFLELRSKYVSFLVSREMCLLYPIADVEAALRQWDSVVVYDYSEWEGLSYDATDAVDQAPVVPYRIVFDIQPSVGYGHSGNPVVVTNDYSWFSGISNFSIINAGGNWGILHEIGHNHQQSNYWSWSTLGETTNNLFSFKVANRLSNTTPDIWPPQHDALESAFANAISFAGTGGDFDGSDSKIDNAFSRLTPFVQIFDYIKPNMDGINNSSNDGWGFMTELYKQSRRAVRPNVSDLTKHDFVYKLLCNYTQYDWEPFFTAWGISISDAATTAMSDLYTPISYKAWTYNPLTRTGGDEATAFYDPSSWSIADYSSQETVGEGSTNGYAARIIDNDISTYWHSQWYGTTATPPHYITINLGRKLSFSGFKFANRQSKTRTIKNLYIDISNDNSTWTTLSDSPFSIPNDITYRSYSLSSSVSAKYVRLRIPATSDVWDGTNYAAIAEFAIVQ